MRQIFYQLLIRLPRHWTGNVLIQFVKLLATLLGFLLKLLILRLHQLSLRDL